MEGGVATLIHIGESRRVLLDQDLYHTEHCGRVKNITYVVWRQVAMSFMLHVYIDINVVRIDTNFNVARININSNAVRIDINSNAVHLRKEQRWNNTHKYVLYIRSYLTHSCTYNLTFTTGPA